MAKEVREAQAQALAREVLGTPEAIRQLHEMHDRRAAGALRSSVAPVTIVSEPARAPMSAFERYCYGEPREPMCLSFDIMHKHSTSFTR